MLKLNEMFNVTYGSKLDLNKMQLLPRSQGGVNFVGRSERNQGVSATIAPLLNRRPYEEGIITVALGGSLLASFVQNAPFYTAQNVAVLKPKVSMTWAEKVWICLCIKHNRPRYSAFGREANRTLRDMLVPELSEAPEWVNTAPLNQFDNVEHSLLLEAPVELNTSEWQPFRYSDLFLIERGKGPRIKNLDGFGAVPFVTSIAGNNGVKGLTSFQPCHRGNVIGVNRNGSVAEAFYQPVPFCSTEDVHIFLPKFEMNVYHALFLCALIRRERYRFSYGRKWGIERMLNHIINLPVTETGQPDFQFMEKYIKTLPFSSQLEPSDYDSVFGFPLIPAMGIPGEKRETELREYGQPALPHLAEIAETGVY